MGYLLPLFLHRKKPLVSLLPTKRDILVHMAEGQGHWQKRSLSLNLLPWKASIWLAVFGLQVLRFWRSTLMGSFNTRMKPSMELYIWKRATMDCHHETKSVLTATAVSVAVFNENKSVHKRILEALSMVPGGSSSVCCHKGK